MNSDFASLYSILAAGLIVSLLSSMAAAASWGGLPAQRAMNNMLAQLLNCSQDSRVAFCIPWPTEIGGPALAIRWYSIILTACVVLGTLVAMRHVRREGEDPAAVLDCVRYFVPAGLIGARLFFVILDIAGGKGSIYLAYPLAIFDIRGGGLNFFGVVACGALAILVYARRIKGDVWLGFDAGALGLWIGQGLGRYNNLINRELYGPPTGSSWFGILIPLDDRLPIYRDLNLYPLDTRFHPTMIYESIWLLLTFVLVFALYLRYRRRYVHGTLVGAYLMVAGTGRFILETWRPDQPRIPGTDLSFSRVLAVLEILIGLLFFLYCTGRLRLPWIAARKGGEKIIGFVDHSSQSPSFPVVGVDRNQAIAPMSGPDENSDVVYVSSQSEMRG